MNTPLISVFTPAHKPNWLADVWGSLKSQTYSNFEWVVLANGPNKKAVADKALEVCSDERRLTILFTEESRGIGALKREACMRSRGELLVELDYDDLLVPMALELIVDRYKLASQKSVFIYSDAFTCTFDMQQPKEGGYVFGEYWGWQHYSAKYGGKDLRINRTFEPTPRSLCEIYYAPDHVRCWSREAYVKTGGHDATMNGGDDHDLICRTYLAGSEFIGINHPLYIHRFEAHNDSSVNVVRNRKQSQANRDKYLHPLIKEWCRREHLPMYDLGGAHDCPEGFVPIDLDLPADLSGLCGNAVEVLERFADNSVGCFRAFDFLEHLPAERIPELMNLVYAKLVPGGYFITCTPAFCDDEGRAGVGAIRDPDHRSFWHSQNWWYYTRRELAKYVHGYKGRFQAIRNFTGYASDWHKQKLLPYVWCDLAALKSGNAWWPGEVRI